MTETKRPSIFIAESEPIYRYIYEASPFRASFDIVGFSQTMDQSELENAISTHMPDVVLLGARDALDHLVTSMCHFREENPRTGVVVLLSSIGDGDVQSLRRLSSRGRGGLTLFFRQNLRNIEQLVDLVSSAGKGRVALDPEMAELIFAETPDCPFLNQLSPKESEILNMLSKGYTNGGIADALYIDVKTVEGRLNSIYSKMKTEDSMSNRHLRVTAATLYLREAGALSGNRGASPALSS